MSVKNQGYHITKFFVKKVRRSLLIKKWAGGGKSYFQDVLQQLKMIMTGRNSMKACISNF
jgi:hypothetical protein